MLVMTVIVIIVIIVRSRNDIINLLSPNTLTYTTPVHILNVYYNR